MKKLFFITYLCYFLPYTLMIPHLEFVAASQAQRNWMFAISALLAMMGQAGIGFICDQFNTISKPYRITLIIVILSGWQLYAAHSTITALIWATLFGAAFRINMGILDSWALESGENGNLRYGIIRGWGAIGGIAGSASADFISRKWGMLQIGNGVILIGLMAFFCSILMPDVKRKQETHSFCLKNVFVLLKNAGYCRMIAILFLINIMANADFLIVIDKMIELNAGSQLISLKWELQSLCELPLFLISTYLLRRWSARGLLTFSLGMYSLRLILTSMASNAELIILISMLQLVTFPLFQIASKILIDRQVPESLRTTGQQLALSIYSGCSMWVSPLIFGAMSACFSNNISLFLTGLIGLIPAWLLFVDSNHG